MISMEAVTAFLEGPGCLLITWAMLKAKPWRFTAILLVSLGQLYGDVLYFGTCLHGGEPGSRQGVLVSRSADRRADRQTSRVWAGVDVSPTTLESSGSAVSGWVGGSDGQAGAMLTRTAQRQRC